ncbi:hypothetical protein A3C96_04025 [Candidatus Uhrbacteria bacterium RIFCSPHIGHO2_02_FULL_60_10]|uniref:Uncharacterized protein n=1 Tax=Candidatus Uhrbacteria bacterium RIFCSPHIGHO2_02_FULL_60_10 TaxID=1802392 RepID=A0A1F7U9T3_9BACT|nr:MAG: hypothetical protein A3C96_04025 [Candidatus Uhrbacteria bacterium RIFCSPHIGHO2_02_FULL_60_10]
MILWACFACLALGYALAVTTAPAPTRAPVRLHTFLVDPLTMLVVGLGATVAFLLVGREGLRAREKFLARKRLLNVLLTAFFMVFIAMEILTYFDVLPHPFDAAKTGNDFMWNGYVDWLFGPLFDTAVPTYRSFGMTALAFLLFLLQPVCLLLGRSLGFKLARSHDPDNSFRSANKN